MTAVYKNFLPTAHFKAMQDLFLTEKIPWHFNGQVVTTEKFDPEKIS